MNNETQSHRAGDGKTFAVPFGMALVPIEPTVEMRTAGANASDLHAYSPVGVWAAMLAAAPSVAPLTLETAEEARRDRAHAEAYYRQAEKLLTANEQTLHAEVQSLSATLKQIDAALQGTLANATNMREMAEDVDVAQVLARAAIRAAAPAAAPAAFPEQGSKAVNDACWAFVEAMPHALPGPIWNDLKPAVYAALKNFAAIQAPAAAPAWQPIETAPRDGADVLLFGGADEIVVGGWAELIGWTDSEMHRLFPTHWMPLPAAPEIPCAATVAQNEGSQS